MINKLQSLKGKTKLKNYENISNHYHEMNNRNFIYEEDPFAKNAQGLIKKYHEVLLLNKLLQTKPQVKNMIINYYDFYYTLIKNRDDLYEDNGNDYIIFIDFITLNHYIGLKPRETIFR